MYSLIPPPGIRFPSEIHRTCSHYSNKSLTICKRESAFYFRTRCCISCFVFLIGLSLSEMCCLFVCLLVIVRPEYKSREARAVFLSCSMLCPEAWNSTSSQKGTQPAHSIIPGGSRFWGTLYTWHPSVEHHVSGIDQCLTHLQGWCALGQVVN